MIKRLFFAFLRRFRYLPLLLFLAWTVGQIFRDLFWTTGLCFYIPSVLVCLLLWAAVWFDRIENRKRFSLLQAACSLIVLCCILFLENQFFRTPAVTPVAQAEQQNNAPASERPVVKLVHWNICRARSGLEKILDRLKSVDADLIALSEVPRDFDLSKVETFFGDDFHAVQEFDLVLIVRGEVKLTSDRMDHDSLPLKSKRLKIMSASCKLVQGPEWDVWIADLVSYLEVPRHPSLLALNEKIQLHQPDLIVGDFNAPRRSWGLSELPEGYQHAYHLKGSGWGYTFPVPVPVYAIDQCIVQDQVQVQSYELSSSLLSDHRLQIVELEPADTK